MHFSWIYLNFSYLCKFYALLAFSTTSKRPLFPHILFSCTCTLKYGTDHKFQLYKSYRHTLYQIRLWLIGNIFVEVHSELLAWSILSSPRYSPAVPTWSKGMQTYEEIEVGIIRIKKENVHVTITENMTQNFEIVILSTKWVYNILCHIFYLLLRRWSKH